MSSLTIGNRTFTWGERTYVMGILNITPDSFSGDGLLAAPLSPLPPFPKEMGGEARVRGAGFLSSGGDIIDIGG